MLPLNDIESADAGSDVHARGVGDVGSNVEARHLHSKIAGRQSDLDEAGHFLEFFFLDPLQWIEILDFAGDLAIEGADIKVGDASDAALAREEICPDLVGANPACA